MKKLFAVLTVLCLLCAACAALAEEETPSWDKMPLVVTVDEGVELTDADFEGDWVVDKVFLGETYLPIDQVVDLGLNIHPMRIADGKLIITYSDEEGEHETSTEYTLDANQITVIDGQGMMAVFEKLEDGNLVMSMFIGDEDAKTCVSFFLIHPEA